MIETSPPTLISVPPLPAADGGVSASAANAVAAKIHNLLGSEVFGSGSESPDHLTASDIAVLVRSARLETVVLNSLERAGIPAILFRSQSVFSRPVTALLRSFLYVLDRPRDIGRWKSILLGNFFNLPASLLPVFEDAGHLDALVECGGEWKDLLLAGRIELVLDSFFRFTAKVAQWAGNLGRKDVSAYLNRTWPSRLLAETDGERHWQDWNHLIDLLQTKQAAGMREPLHLIRWMDESACAGDSEGRNDALRLESESPAVRVMTMHASKGLEFPLVFVIGGLTGKSSRNQGGDYRFDVNGQLYVDLIRRDAHRDSHLAYEWEETKRLWYVAFTRASRRLWILRPQEGVFTQVESLLAEAGGLSSSSELPPHETLNTAGGEALRERLNETLHAWSEGAQPLLTLERAEEPGIRVPAESGHEPLSLGALPGDIVGLRDPVTSSYTSLTRKDPLRVEGSESEAGDEKDVDGFPENSGAADPGQPRFPLPESGGEILPLEGDRGALFGTLIHSLFEECDFHLAREDEEQWFGDEGNLKLFRTLAGRYYRPEWYNSRSESLMRLVRTALRSPIPGLGILSQLPKNRMRAEVEFLTALPEASRINIGGPDIQIPSGFLKGFIDLLIHTGGKWWVLDWKTNVPAGALWASDYTKDTVLGIMDSHHYHLQYELYLLSLCQVLYSSGKEPVDWDEQIGGAAYLFVRGMRESDDRGIFVGKPEKSRMQELAAALGLGGILK